MLGEHVVRWLILLGVAGLPVTILASWFLESPWREKRWLAIAGDLAIIAAIVVAAFLFAWQQWFTAFTRPTLAVLKIEATDTRVDSEDLAVHLATRFRTALATRPELRVIELSSSQHASLDGQPMAQKAAALAADLLLSGTLAQHDSQLRLNVQLYSSDGSLIHSQTFADRLLDQAQLQNRVLAEFWPHLPLSDQALSDVRKRIGSCKYPNGRDALLAIAAIDNGTLTNEVAGFVGAHNDAGMLHLAYARLLFRQLAAAATARKPVLQPIAMQHLAAAETRCPDMPDVDLLRLENTLDQRGDESLLLQHPNSARLYLDAAEQHSEPARATALFREAELLDPLRN